MASAQTKIHIAIDGQSMIAELIDNAATRSLVERLSSGPITISMNNYGGFEKVGALPWSLPSEDKYISTKPGDIMLYTSNNLVIFYGENSWDYTPLGILETTDPKVISEFVGTGTKQVTLSLSDIAGIEQIEIDPAVSENIYTLDGRLVYQRPLKPGFYIIDNNKVIVK